MRLLRPLLLGCLAVAMPLAAPAAAPATPDILTAKPVVDLHYGDVLFTYFAGDEFETLTRLNAYSQWQRLPGHGYDAELLAGGLYLSLGMHNEAGVRFNRLLTPEIPVGVRNRAWFYLAKVWYARGYFDRAEEALARISGTLTPELEAERQHLYINTLLRQERFAEAAERVRGWRGTSDWVAYARFNLGVALIRQGHVAEADAPLTAVGMLATEREEFLALRDKANLALGFAWLAAKEPAKARTALNRVRLNGPFASRALLGVGWADVALGDFRAALTPWLELHERSLLDVAVQESYLAVPYAYAQLGAHAQAARYYEAAIAAFKDESRHIDAAVAHIGEGRMLDELLGQERDGRLGWFWQLRDVPDSAQSHYLYTLLADNDFQEGLKNYRDMSNYAATLARWDENMQAFAYMIDTRQKAFAERLPATDSLLASSRPQQLLMERTRVDVALTAAETGNDVAALGTAREREQWATIRGLETALAETPPGAARDATADKLRLLKGALQWQLDEKFKERDYAARTSLREIDSALNEMQNRWSRVQRARALAPTYTAGFAERIAALNGRLAALRAEMDVTRERQNRFLSRLAQTQLLAQKQRLAGYELQAQFALADIYDRSAESGQPGVPGAAAPAAGAP